MATKKKTKVLMDPKPANLAHRIWAMVRLHDDVELYRHKDSVATEIRSKLSGLEYFLPLHEEKIGNRGYIYVLFDGYFFVLHNGTVGFEASLRRARGSYLDGPVLELSGRLAYVKDSVIEGYKKTAREKASSYEPTVGEVVTCLHEALERVDGVVVDIDKVNKLAHIKIKLRSREILAPVKFANIQPKDTDPDAGAEWIRLF